MHVQRDLQVQTYKETYAVKYRLLHASRRVDLRYVECDNIYMTLCVTEEKFLEIPLITEFTLENGYSADFSELLPGACYCMLLVDIYIGM